MMPYKLHGTLLTRDEFQDNLRLRYGLRPLCVCSYCDGYDEGFSVEHRLSCTKGGLVTMRHGDYRNEAGALTDLALTAGKFSYEPLINYGRDLSAAMPGAATATGNGADKEARGDVLVH